MSLEVRQTAEREIQRYHAKTESRNGDRYQNSLILCMYLIKEKFHLT
jgi:hypothetical protein